MNRNASTVLMDLKHEKISKYMKSLKNSEYDFDIEELNELEREFEEQLEKIKSPLDNQILGTGTAGLVFTHKDPNIVCKFGGFLDLYNEVRYWVYLSNLTTRGLVMSVEIKSFHMIPFVENVEELMFLIAPDQTKVTIHRLKTIKRYEAIIKEQFDIAAKEYENGKFMAILTEDKVSTTVERHLKGGKFLDSLFLFEYLYFEYICWKYLGVWQVDDSHLGNLGVIESKKPVIYKVDGTMFKFDKGLGFRRIDFGDVFRGNQWDRPLITNILLTDDNLRDNFKNPPKRKKLFFSLEDGLMIDPETFLFDDPNVNEFAQKLHESGIDMNDFGLVIKKMFAGYIIETLPFDETSYVLIDADKYSTSKRKMEEPTSNPKQPKHSTHGPYTEEIMETINRNHKMIADLIPRKKSLYLK